MMHMKLFLIRLSLTIVVIPIIIFEIVVSSSLIIKRNVRDYIKFMRNPET